MFEPFLCQDTDVTQYLKETSIQFEELNLTKTYLIFIPHDPTIAGYFSLTLKSFQIEGPVSNTLYKNIFGTKKPSDSNKEQKHFPTYLISQLGRNTSKFTNDILPGDIILQLAFSEIKRAQSITGGRTMVVECADIPCLIDFYERNGFRRFHTYPITGYIRFIRKIN